MGRVVPGKALIADDDQSIRFVLSDMLRRDGWAVDAVDDGAAVEEHLEQQRYDLLLLDLYMPGMNGFEVLRRIRHAASTVHPAWKTPPTVAVIVLSGAAGNDGLTFATHLGADACVRKPFALADVRAAISSLK